MSTLLREIIAPFLKVDPSAIEAATFIDRTAVGSSIVFHRMFARLSEAGFKMSEYHDIRTFGELELRLSGQGDSGKDQFIDRSSQPNIGSVGGRGSVGIDLVEVASMPVAADFRESEFYKMNFTDTEISHCVLQPNPHASFAGLFAAKEAICKADDRYRSSPFRTIEIQWEVEGKPIFPGMEISITHTDHAAAAVAILLPVQEAASHSGTSVFTEATAAGTVPGWILFAVVTSLLLSVAACILVYVMD